MTAALEMASRWRPRIKLYAIAADQLRLLYHALRGESEQVQYYRDRVELFAVQGSTTWQAENLLAGHAAERRRVER